MPVTLPSFALPPLKDFSFSGPGFDFEDGFAGLMFDLSYSGSIPDVPCGECVLGYIYFGFKLNTLVSSVLTATHAARGVMAAVAALFRTPRAAPVLAAARLAPRMSENF